jgi:hypothetical protein
MIEAGCAVALASDFNPGSCPIGSVPMIQSIACSQMRLLPAEALVDCTLNAAWALGLAAEVGSLAPGKAAITDRFFNQEGAAQFAQADAAIVAINDFLASRGLTVQGARAVGGNRDGMGTLGLGEASSFGEALGSLSFGANDNERLSSYLGGQSFTDPAKLQAAVDGFLAAQAAIESLGAEAVPQFTAQLDAINKAFDDASETAKAMRGISRSIGEISDLISAPSISP